MHKKSVATLSERRVAQIKQLSGHYLWTPLMKKKVCILYKLRQLESLQKLRPCSFFPKPKGKEGKNIKLSFRIWGNKNKDKNLLVCIPRNSFVNFLHSKTRKKKRTKIFLISKIMGLRECIKMHKAENLKPVYPAKMDKESLKTRTEV